jgi:hypothetical protein
MAGTSPAMTSKPLAFDLNEGWNSPEWQIT